MIHMKKFAALILALAMAMSLAACNGGKRDFSKVSSSSDLNLTTEEINKLAAED